MKQTIFISSVQKELAPERRALKDYIEGDPLFGQLFKVFLFEDLPASDRRTDDVYLAEVDRCGIYLGIFGNDYGNEDAEGVSPTEREFDRATAAGKTRLIYVKGADDKGRQPKMAALIRKAGDQLIRRRFAGVSELTAAVYASLVGNLTQSGLLRTRPFDASACLGSTLADISDDKVQWFLERARQGRQFVLAVGTPSTAVLEHLNLLDGDTPTHAALLLFGDKPQRFLLTSELKCMRFHGTEVRKPIPSYQIYKGTVFELVDQAVDFVMGKIDRAVGTRAESNQAPVTYELPRDAVAEAIVNAVVHRDYASNASVQVMLFADRLEVRNPGVLPATLTFERLRRPHASIPHNPLVCEPAFLAQYAEKAGSGILDMIALCRDAGLPEPEFRQDGGEFVQTIWRPKTATAPQVGIKSGSSRDQVATQVTTQVEYGRNTLADICLGELASALGLVTTQVTTQVAMQVAEVLGTAAAGAKSREELQTVAGMKNREHFRKAYVEPLVNAGWLEQTIPAKPTSRLQQYRLTEKGRTWLAVKKTSTNPAS